jgi:hypothetical protein
MEGGVWATSAGWAKESTIAAKVSKIRILKRYEYFACQFSDKGYAVFLH